MQKYIPDKGLVSEKHGITKLNNLKGSDTRSRLSVRSDVFQKKTHKWPKKPEKIPSVTCHQRSANTKHFLLVRMAIIKMTRNYMIW